MLIQDLSIIRNTRNYCNFAILISWPNFFPARESESPKPVVELSLVNELEFSSEDEDDERDKGNIWWKLKSKVWVKKNETHWEIWH